MWISNIQYIIVLSLLPPCHEWNITFRRHHYIVAKPFSDNLSFGHGTQRFFWLCSLDLALPGKALIGHTQSNMDTLAAARDKPYLEDYITGESINFWSFPGSYKYPVEVVGLLSTPIFAITSCYISQHSLCVHNLPVLLYAVCMLSSLPLFLCYHFTIPLLLKWIIWLPTPPYSLFG